MLLGRELNNHFPSRVSIESLKFLLRPQEWNMSILVLLQLHFQRSGNILSSFIFLYSSCNGFLSSCRYWDFRYCQNWRARGKSIGIYWFQSCHSYLLLILWAVTREKLRLIKIGSHSRVWHLNKAARLAGKKEYWEQMWVKKAYRRW